MPRVIHHQVTTIQITSVEVTWEDEREQIPVEAIELAPTISESERTVSVSGGNRKPRERKPAGGRKSGASSHVRKSKRERKSSGKRPPDPAQSSRPGSESDAQFRREEEVIPAELKE